MQAAQRLASHDENDSDWQRELAEAWESLGEAREAQADLEGAGDAFTQGCWKFPGGWSAKDPGDTSAQRLITLSSGKLAAIREKQILRTLPSASADLGAKPAKLPLPE